MQGSLQFSAMLPDAAKERPARLGVFALLCLGMVESLTNGAVSATDAMKQFFHAQNCLYVRKKLRESVADELMSRGEQLPDLFAVLPPEEAQRQFRHELATMRALCLKLLDEKRMAA